MVLSPPPTRHLSVTESIVVLPPDLTGVDQMPDSHYHSEPSLLPIERPRCPKCQGAA
jgi:hypothetical protein